MDELAREYVISFFDRNLLLHGDRPEAVRWTAKGQRPTVATGRRARARRRWAACCEGKGFGATPD